MLKNILVCILLFVWLHCVGQDPGPFTEKDTRPLLAELKNSIQDSGKVQLLLKLSDQYYYRLNRQQADISNALFYTQAAKKLSISLACHKGEGISELLLSRILPLKNQKEDGRKSAMKAIEIFTKNKEYFLLGETYFTLSGYYPITEKGLKERIPLANKALQAVQLGGFKEKEGHLFKEIADLYLIQGNTGLALSNLKQALTLFQSIGYTRLMGVYDLLGTIYTDLGSPDEGIKYGLLALNNAETFGDTSMQLCTIYNRLGITYFSIADYKKAYEFLDKSLQIAIKYKDVEAINVVAANMAKSMILLRKPKDGLAFLKNIVRKYPPDSRIGYVSANSMFLILSQSLKQFAQADKYSNLLTVAEMDSLTEDERINLYNLLVPFYISRNNMKSAVKYLALHKQLTDKTESQMYLYQNYLWRAQLDSAKGNYQSAFINFKKYNVLKDSIFKETKLRQISQLEIIYDVEKKNDNIELLTKQSQLQKNMLKQANLVQNITNVSLALLLIIIVLLIIGYRLTQKNNRNITAKQEEINHKNISLEHLVTEKEWLIKEIHHRVKNNLHMVAGLLDSQSEYLKSDEARMAIADSQHRIQSMSMIHQKLYQTENLSSIDMSAYIHEMVQYLKESFESGRLINFNLDIDRVKMNISHSIPLGLILNEAITNAIKYAFPSHIEGIISITFKQKSAQNFVLIVADNGIGLRPDFDINKVGSFGLALIQGLCDDIGATLNISNDNGTVIKTDFLYQPEV